MSTPDEHIPVVTRQTPEYQVLVPGGSFEIRPVPETSPDNPAWDILASLLLWLSSVLAVFIVPTIVALPYIMYRYWGVPNATQTLATDHIVLLLSVIGVIPTHAVTLFLAWAVVTQRGKRPFWGSLGWNFSPGFGLWPTVGVAVALYFVGAIVANLIGGKPTDIDILVNSSLAARIILVILATTTGPLVEEIVYRGVIYSALRKRIGMTWSVVIVSFLFVFVHLFQYWNSLGVIAVILILSVSLTLVRAFTGRLLPCVIIHMVFNGIVSALILLQPFFEKPEKIAAPKAAIVLLWRMMRPLI